jgi:hypothetical protein
LHLLKPVNLRELRTLLRRFRAILGFEEGIQSTGPVRG